MNRKLPLLAALVGALGLAACGGGAAPASSPASSAGTAPSVAASKPAPAASSAPAAASKPAASISAKPAASGAPAKPAAPPAAARTPVVEVAQVPPGPSTPAVAQLGAVPVASRPPLPAKYNEAVGPYSMYMEVIASAAPSTTGLLAIPGCVVDSVFKRGMRVIFRYELYDMASGKRVTDRDGATAKVQLAANQTVDSYFAPRGTPPPPPDAPWTWVGVWNIPTDFPLGNVVPSVLVTAKDGKSTTLKTTDFAGMLLQIVD